MGQQDTYSTTRPPLDKEGWLVLIPKKGTRHLGEELNIKVDSGVVDQIEELA